MAKLVRRYRKFVNGKDTYELQADRAKPRQGRCNGLASFRLTPAGNQRIGSGAGFISFLEWAAPNSWSEPTQTAICEGQRLCREDVPKRTSNDIQCGAVRVVGGSCLDRILLGVIQLQEPDILHFTSFLVEDESINGTVPDQTSDSAKTQVMNRAGRLRAFKHTTVQHGR